MRIFLTDERDASAILERMAFYLTPSDNVVTDTREIASCNEVLGLLDVEMHRLRDLIAQKRTVANLMAARDVLFDLALTAVMSHATVDGWAKKSQ